MDLHKNIQFSFIKILHIILSCYLSVYLNLITILLQGIFNNVTLNMEILKNWTMSPIAFKNFQPHFQKYFDNIKSKLLKYNIKNFYFKIKNNKIYANLSKQEAYKKSIKDQLREGLFPAYNFMSNKMMGMHMGLLSIPTSSSNPRDTFIKLSNWNKVSD